MMSCCYIATDLYRHYNMKCFMVCLFFCLLQKLLWTVFHIFFLSCHNNNNNRTFLCEYFPVFELDVTKKKNKKSDCIILFDLMIYYFVKWFWCAYMRFSFASIFIIKYSSLKTEYFLFCYL